MAKLISVSEEAYSRLFKLKGRDRSFTRVILELTDKNKGDIMDLFGALKMDKEEVKMLKNRLKKERETIFVRT